MHLFIVRHAESDTNVNDEFRTYTNGDLTLFGEQQAKFCAKELGNIDFKRVYSSHLLRAIKTAQIVGRTKDVLQFEELGEMNGGDYEGKTWNEIDQVHPDFHIRMVDSLSKIALPHGESYEDVKKRLSQFINKELLSSNLKSDDYVLIVSHGITLRILINMLVGETDRTVGTLHWADNTAVTHIELGEKNILHRLLCNEHLIKNGMNRADYEIWAGKEYVLKQEAQHDQTETHEKI